MALSLLAVVRVSRWFKRTNAPCNIQLPNNGRLCVGHTDPSKSRVGVRGALRLQRTCWVPYCKNARHAMRHIVKCCQWWAFGLIVSTLETNKTIG